MSHKDCKYKNGFCQNHFPWNGKGKVIPNSWACIYFVCFFLPFSLETTKIIIDSGVFLVYTLFCASCYCLFHFTVVIVVACDAYVVRHFRFQIEKKTMDFLIMFSLFSLCCFHVWQNMSWKFFFSKLFSLSNRVECRLRCELLMWNGKVYADGLQFKWFLFYYYCPRFLISYQFEQVDDAMAFNVF